MLYKRKQVTSLLFTVLLLVSVFLYSPNQANANSPNNQKNVVDIGKDHFLILKGDGSVWSWGNNTYGQLGAKVTGDSTTPVVIQRRNGSRLANIVSISAGGNHSAALDTSGKVWTWGSNGYGQLGYATVGNKNDDPMMVADLPPIVAISTGDSHTLAVDENGAVWAWGRNAFGQLGRVTPLISSTEPLRINGGSDFSNIVAVTAGSEHSVALKTDGTVFTWGRNSFGQLGNGETGDENVVPQKVPGLTNIIEITAGNNHTLALKQDRTTIWAWGSNSYGQLGDGGRESKLQPVQVEGIQNVSGIAAGDNHTVAIKTNGTVWTWGRNTSGTASARTTPIQISGLTNAVAIGGGGEINSYTVAAGLDGTVWKWDKLSSDSTTKLPIFQKVSGIEDVMKLDEFPFIQGGQVLFRYVGNNNIGEVKLNGSFNDNIDLPMVQKEANVWELQVELQPGEYNYGFKVNGNWTVDPLNRDKTVDNFGRPFSVLRVAPYAPVGPIIDNKEVTFTYNSYDSQRLLELDAKTVSASVIGNFGENYHWIEIPLVKQKNNIWKLTRTMEPGEYYYSFIVRDSVSGVVPEKRNDPLNSSLQTDSLTGISRNPFTVAENVLTKIPVSGISLSKGPELDLTVGEQEFVAARISPSNATNKNVNWETSKSSVVSVVGGVLTAHSKGTAVITASSVDGGKMAMLTVHVHQQDNAVSFPRVGYKEFFSPRQGVSPTKPWKISFGQEPDMTTVNRDTVYVMNESGVKVPIGYQLLADTQTIEVRLLEGFKYERGATYYLFVEPTVKSRYSKAALKDPVQMKFQIQL
ncbi:Ig-like domain-containing protein [Sporosarcina ureae]|uniref:BIG2 domain-containing protein n=1 Tax=Sporosarcina ureae TaxID=1571 RepID=A0ABN4YY74_SPOUR|nr:Ig-like domain-containing protein [Sporosarcina ureae]ARF14915.1 hypothetical protein SporoS204_12580 [Sporosarcina ureae]